MKITINGTVIDTDKLAKNRMTDKDLWHNGFHPILPVNLVESVTTAKNQISYSNYDCNNLSRLIEIMMRYCEEHGISLTEPTLKR